MSGHLIRGPRRSLGSRCTERGAVAAELAMAVPALLLVLSLLVAGGRLWFARTTVVEAADTAARAASLARSGGEAAAAGRDAGEQSLTTAGLRCASRSVSVNTAAFSVPVGTPATINATVSCTVFLSDLLLPVIPGSIGLTANGASALDTYRARS